MKYKKDDGKKDNWLDDILWGVPLGDSFAINLKSGEVIPRYRIGDGFIPGENGDDDWEKDEFAFDADDDWDKEDWEKDEFAFDDDDDDDDEYEFELSFDFGIRDASEFSRRDADTTEEQYYDPDRRVYCVGRAIRDNFKEIADSFSVEEMFSLVQCINVIFSSNQKLAVDAVAWAVENFPKSLEGATCEGYRCGLPTDQFFVRLYLYRARRGPQPRLRLFGDSPGVYKSGIKPSAVFASGLADKKLSAASRRKRRCRKIHRGI